MIFMIFSWTEVKWETPTYAYICYSRENLLRGFARMRNSVSAQRCLWCFGSLEWSQIKQKMRGPGSCVVFLLFVAESLSRQLNTVRLKELTNTCHLLLSLALALCRWQAVKLLHLLLLLWTVHLTGKCPDKCDSRHTVRHTISRFQQFTGKFSGNKLT